MWLVDPGLIVGNPEVAAFPTTVVKRASLPLAIGEQAGHVTEREALTSNERQADRITSGWRVIRPELQRNARSHQRFGDFTSECFHIGTSSAYREEHLTQRSVSSAAPSRFLSV
jgi:hypothetical protein